MDPPLFWSLFISWPFPSSVRVSFTALGELFKWYLVFINMYLIMPYHLCEKLDDSSASQMGICHLISHVNCPAWSSKFSHRLWCRSFTMELLQNWWIYNMTKIFESFAGVAKYPQGTTLTAVKYRRLSHYNTEDYHDDLKPPIGSGGYTYLL